MPAKRRRIENIDDQLGYDPDENPYKIPSSNHYKGCYAIGVDDPGTGKQRIAIKIGMGGYNVTGKPDTDGNHNLFSRIRNYNTCFPDGVFIYCLMFLTGAVKGTVKQKSEYLRQIENEILNLLDKYRHKSKLNVRLKGKSEWVDASVRQVRSAFVTVQKNHGSKLFVLFPSQKLLPNEKPHVGLPSTRKRK